MKTSSVSQFLIVIPPSKPLSQYASYKKEYLRKHMGKFESAYSVPHITLFNYEDSHNDSRLYDLELQAAQFSAFSLYTTSYDIFDHGENKTIYMKFIYNGAACDIVEKLDDKKITPHLTIARNLSPKEFDKAWKLLKNDSFNYCFQCSSITVLKREPGNFWNNYMEFKFQKIIDRIMPSPRSVSSQTETINKINNMEPTFNEMKYGMRNSKMILNEVYFWTDTIKDWKFLLEGNHFKSIIIDSWHELVKRRKLIIYSFVIMPNHLHLIWEMKEKNGKEMPNASFNKFTSHQFLK